MTASRFLLARQLPGAAVTKRQVMSAASAWACLGFALMCIGPLVPLHLPPWPSFHAEAVSAFGFGLVCVACLVQGGPVRWPLLGWASLAASSIPLLQAALGLIYFQGDAWLATTYLLWLSLAIAVGASLRSEGTRLAEFAAGAVLVTTVLSAAVGLCQWLQLNPVGDWMTNLRPGDRPFGNLAQPNQFATWLTLGVVASHFLYRRRWLSIPTLLVVTAFLAVGQAMSQSRTGVVEMCALAVFALVISGRAELGKSRAVLSGHALFLIALALAWTPVNDLLMLSPAKALERDVTGHLRLTHWSTVIDAISRHPWVGYGYGQVSVAQAQVAADHAFTGELIEHSHNIVLDVLAWNGVPIGAALILLFTAWLVRAVFRCRSANQALALAAVIALLVHGCLEYPLEYAYFLLPLGLIVGALERDAGTRWSMVLGRRTSAAILAAVSALSLWLAVEYMVIEESYRSIRLEMAGFTAGEPPGSPPDVVLLTQRRELLRYARFPAHPAMSPEELDWMRKVSERFGTPPVLLRYAIATGLNGHPDVAARALATLCKTGTADRCQEGIVAWKTMSGAQYPELRNVRLPPEPLQPVAATH